jgi:hypothetical protein
MEDGLRQALKCLEAMQGQDDECRKALWRAAKRYHQRTTARAHRGNGRAGGAMHTDGLGSSCVWTEWD